MFNIRVWKTCAKCKREMPATQEFFHYRSSASELCKSDCRECRSASQRGVPRPARLSRVELFWTKVDKNGPIIRPELGPCWVWTGFCNEWGYGKFGVEERHIERAHRFSWVLAFGDMGDLWVLHRCDNPPCVNPGHLFLGTHTDNMRDMVQKGRKVCRDSRGEKNGRDKLTEAQVREIRQRYKPGYASFHSGPQPCSLKSLALEYGVSKKLILNIVKGRAWPHLV